MGSRWVFLCLWLIACSCTQKLVPETGIQQATKPLSYYLPPAYDITIQEAQTWLAHHEYKRSGSWVPEKQLDWKRAKDFGFFLEVPFKSSYQGPSINSHFDSKELAKLSLIQTEWHLTISKRNNQYLFHISALVPTGQFINHHSKQDLLACAKQKNGIYSGLWLNFSSNGNLVGGMEFTNGHGQIINTLSKRLPSTELAEIKREIYNDSVVDK